MNFTTENYSELAFWQSHMPSVLFTKKLSGVVSLHKQASCLPWRGFCSPRFQYLVQTVVAEGSSRRVAFPLLTSSHAQLEWGESHSHFSGGHISGGPKSWTHPHFARIRAKLCLNTVIWRSEQPGRLGFCGWAISWQSTSLNIVQLSLMHEFFSTALPERKDFGG